MRYSGFAGLHLHTEWACCPRKREGYCSWHNRRIAIAPHWNHGAVGAHELCSPNPRPRCNSHSHANEKTHHDRPCDTHTDADADSNARYVGSGNRDCWR
jgi:hypothetical protein